MIEALALTPNASVADIGAGSFLLVRGAQLSVNGKGATAKVFMQDRFGNRASSCCLAWSDQAVLARHKKMIAKSAVFFSYNDRVAPVVTTWFI